jgi:hypothetical protein
LNDHQTILLLLVSAVYPTTFAGTVEMSLFR